MKRLIKAALAMLAAFMVCLVPLALTGCDGNNDDTYTDGENNGTEDNTSDEDKELVLTDKSVQALVSLNIREEPSTSSLILGTLATGAELTYIDTYDSSWYRVYYLGCTAYVSAKSSYSRIVDEKERQLSIEAVISAGQKLLGATYVYGAERLLYDDGTLNPYYTGASYDCSSFVQYCFYTGAGVKLLSTSRSQSTQGIEIAASDLQRGDVIFMYSTARQYNTGIERIGHVAIYLGNGMIMHTYGADGVVIQSYSAYWQARFIKAARMI